MSLGGKLLHLKIKDSHGDGGIFVKCVAQGHKQTSLIVELSGF